MIISTIQSRLLLVITTVFQMVGCAGGSNTIYTAIDNDDPKMIAMIAKQNKSALNSMSISGATPLLHAISGNKKAAFRSLLENGADPNQLNRRNWCATLEAARNPDPYWLREVMKHGGNPNLDNHASPQHHTTILFEACNDACLDNVKMLVTEYGADLDYVLEGQDALIYSTDHGSLKVVLFLLEHGADFRRKAHKYNSFATSFSHRRPHDYQNDEMRADFLRIVTFLKKSGVEWDKPVKDGDVFVYQ